MTVYCKLVKSKIIYKGKYYYNGIAKRGAEFTQNLKGKPHWYRGKFNMGITDMDVNIAPNTCILVKKELSSRVRAVSDSCISNLEGEFKGLRMTYAPEAVITLRGAINE